MEINRHVSSPQIQDSEALDGRRAARPKASQVGRPKLSETHLLSPLCAELSFSY